MNRRRSLLFGIGGLVALLLLFTAGASGTFQVGIEQTPVPNLSLTGTIAALAAGNEKLATQIAVPTPTATSPVPTQQEGSTPSPDTPTPTRAPAHFENLHFTLQPEPDISMRYYAAGTPRIYAVWDYKDMRAGMVVRREWRRNNEILYSREETWDMNAYGASGTRRDVPIFDEENGLQAGEYSLTLYIDGIYQEIERQTPDQDPGMFWIFPHSVRSPVSSPDLAYTAYVYLAGRLSVESPDGSMRELVVTQEISSVAWFPDNLHLLFEERDRTRQQNAVEDWGITHKLWILNIETGDRHLVGTSGENFHAPVISPGGRYIAALAGETRRNGCSATPSLVILELDSELRRQAVYSLSDFVGLPYEDSKTFQVYPSERHSVGWWEDTTLLAVPLSWTCLDPNQNPQGTYLLNVITKEVNRGSNR